MCRRSVSFILPSLLIFLTATAHAGVPSSLHEFAQVGDGGGLRTLFLIMNQNSAPCQYTLSFLDDGGQPWSVNLGGVVADHHTAMIPPLGSVSLATSGESPTVMGGWARLTAHCEVGAQAFFEIRTGATLATQAAVEATGPLRSADLFVNSGGGSDTGIAVASLSEAGPVRVHLEALDAFGASQATSSFDLPPLAHVAKYFSELFKTLGDFQGTMRLRATGPVVVTTLQQTGLVIGTLPPVLATQKSWQ